MPTIGLTIAGRVDTGWECVDDAGRRVVVPLDSIDPTLRALRVAP